jgi:hypothetical protein
MAPWTSRCVGYVLAGFGLAASHCGGEPSTSRSLADDASPAADVFSRDGTVEATAAPAFDGTLEASPDAHGVQEMDATVVAEAGQSGGLWDGSIPDDVEAAAVDAGASPPDGSGASAERDSGADTSAGGEGGGGRTSIFCQGCPPGFGYCSGLCVSATEPTMGCGSCTPCALPNADATCSGGACAILRCHDGWIDADGDASDGCEVNATNAACLVDGGCTGSTPLCGPAGCTASCPSGLTACGDSCIDLTSSQDDCGECGVACSRGFSCFAGLVCAPPEPCNAPQVACGGGVLACADPDPSVQNCLNCGLEGCSQANESNAFIAQCTATTCIQECQPGWTSCPLPQPDGDPGIEGCVVIQTDTNNCGACGVACDEGDVCIAGVCVPYGAEYIATDLNDPEFIAVDATNVFWIDGVFEDDGGEGGRIATMSKMGGAVETIAPIQDYVSGYPRSLALDDAFVYWTGWNDIDSHGTVARAPKDGSGPPLVLASPTEPGDLALVGTMVYFVDGNGAIETVPKMGGTPTIFAQVPSYTYLRLVTDGVTLYAERYLTAELTGLSALPYIGIPVRISVSTGQESVFGGQINGFGPIAVDATRAYFGTEFNLDIQWFDLGDSAAGEVQAPFGTQIPVDSFVSADCGLYFNPGYGVYFSTLTATPTPAVVGRSQYTPTDSGMAAIAIDATYLYWIDNEAIAKVPRP